MDDFALGLRPAERHDLVGWALAPGYDGGLLLGLKYAAGSEADSLQEQQVQVLVPPEAALSLSRELARQAHQILQSNARREASAG